MDSKWSSSGFVIAPFGKGRNAIQSKHANDLVDALNILGRIKIKRADKDEVFYSDTGLTLQLKDEEIALSESEQAAPFEIYQSGTWLQYKVKTGIIIANGDPITASDIETEFVLTSGVLRYWFYIEMDSTTASINVSSTTQEWSVNKIPIGWVDTQSGSSSSISTIYQVLRDHVFNPCSEVL